MSAASVRFIAFAGRPRPADPVERADFETSVADLRAAVCISAGVAIGDISPLGYDHSDAGYARVRTSWVRHLEQWGYTLFDSYVDEAFALWQAARPDLAAGDNWRAAGVAAHKVAYPDGSGCFYEEACVICHPCEEN
jgi:hypothetical protein